MDQPNESIDDVQKTGAPGYEEFRGKNLEIPLFELE